MKRTCSVALLLAIWLTCANPAAADPPARHMVVDPTGRTVEVPAEPLRVVALAPSITEIVYALGQQQRLVGVTRFSDYPPAAAQLPKVGSYVQLDVERIAALKPDLCIGVKDGNPLAVVEQLQSLRTPVFAVNPHNLKSVMQSVAAMGEILGARPRAQTLISQMRERIQQVTARTAQAGRKPRVFLQIGVSPIVSVGSNTFMDELITLAGGTNVAAGPNPYPRFSREQVIALAPEVIIISSMARATVFEQVKAEWLRWPAIPAVRDHRVFIAPTNLFDRPTPRLVDALELMACYIHPELFEVKP